MTDLEDLLAPASSRPHRLLYLSRNDVAHAGGSSSHLFVDAVARALHLHAGGGFAQPLKPYLRWRPDGHVADRIIAMPAYLGGSQPVAGIKWIGSRHDNARLGLDRASALVVLNDPETHFPVAVLEGGLISLWRTAAVTVLAARHLARPHFRSVAVVGCGPVGTLQVRGLLEHATSVTEVRLFDLRPEAAETLAAAAARRFPDVAFRVMPSAEKALHGAEVVVTATIAASPWLPPEWLAPGSFLSNVSLMDAFPEVLLEVDKVVVDDWDQCNREGKVIHRLVSEGRFSRTDVHAELGQVLVGDRPGREDADERIALNPMGMAVEDVACAQAVRDRALDAGIGTWLDLA